MSRRRPALRRHRRRASGGGGTPARYWRVEWTASHGAWYAAFRNAAWSDDGGSTEEPSVAMTSNSAPSPYVASSSTNWSGYEPYKGFNDVTAQADHWLTGADGDAGATFTLDLGASNDKAMNWFQYNNVNYGGNDNSPTELKFKRSDTGAWAGEEVLEHTESGMPSRADGAIVTITWTPS